jgi:predicted TIM-barrel fold metal-dependent hydrolase
VSLPPQKACPPADPAPRQPKVVLPPDSCDTHAHIFGPATKYAWSMARGYTPPDALPATYDRLHKVLGVTRAVVTQPSVYGIDNAATLDYVSADLSKRRAVVSVGADVTDKQLRDMHDKGARGIRVNIADPGGNPFKSFAELERVAERLKAMGWHIELLLHVTRPISTSCGGCQSICRSAISATCRPSSASIIRSIAPSSISWPKAIAG